MDIDPQAIKGAFDGFKSVLDALKSLRDLWTGKPQEKEALTAQIEIAERQVALAEAQLAQALGYPLCRKHFPPKPMLADRFDPKSAEQIYKCADCGQEHPSPEHFEMRARTNARIDGLARRASSARRT